MSISAARLSNDKMIEQLFYGILGKDTAGIVLAYALGPASQPSFKKKIGSLRYGPLSQSPV